MGGGPQGDAGLTGRKIIIDTYGGWGAHGGGAFSGKDPTKVDRSAAYICRQMAKSVVKSGLSKRALVQLSYAIGVAKPLSLFVETYGTEQGALTPEDITKVVKIAFDCRPGAIAKSLQLREPKYTVTAAYGHFGRQAYTENGIKFFEWESPVDLSKYQKMQSAGVEARAQPRASARMSPRVRVAVHEGPEHFLIRLFSGLGEAFLHAIRPVAEVPSRALHFRIRGRSRMRKYYCICVPTEHVCVSLCASRRVCAEDVLP